MKYSFKYITCCNLCGSSSNAHKVIGKRLNQSQGKNPRKKIGITTSIIKCTNCNLIYSNPQPVPDDIQDHYGLPPENYWIDDYFTFNENYFKAEIEILRTLIDFKKGMKSLDIGAGLGKAMTALSTAGFDAYGFEPSQPFYERAINRMKISSEKLKLGMIEEIEYPDNHFDFITFGAVLEHLYDPSAAITKSLKWLKPNGIIHIEVPSSNWLVGKIINLYYSIRGLDYVGNLSPMHAPYHLYEFGLKSFEDHAISNNYEVILHQYYVCQTYMPKIIDYIITPFMKKTDTGMQLCVWLKKK
ncbi:class I SAM-dependent methyltransferase [Mucilaginibacter sp.]|uniref:class I SAM-dependent methyltransferase n=1 Tax=Mucilaginibacter sp. TaxID=1882438 RepID=UPI002627E92E|nr:class I SAM-dependent methyltransferase [Mucilaginibacter sp.]